MPHAKIHPVGITQRTINMCLVAESGFGKSVLLGTPGKKMCILSVDPEGADSAFFQGSKADEWVARTYDDLNEAYQFFSKQGWKEYEWVGIDSVPEVQKILQGDWLDKNREKAGKRHPDVLGIDGYQITQNQLIKFVKMWNDIPINVVYTAKPLELSDAEGNPYYLPNLHGQKGDVAADFTGYMKIQGFGTYHGKKVRKADTKEVVDVTVRRYYFSPHGPFKGKDRTDSLGLYLDDPTLPQIADLVEKKALTATGGKSAGTKKVATKKTTVRRRTTRS